MKKIFFIILYLSVVYMAVNESKVLAVESESGILNFSVDKRTFLSESKNEPISINIEIFNWYISYRVEIVDRVYNTRKAGEDVISFSVDAGEVQYHDIRCRISYLELIITDSIFHKVLFFNDCGNQEIRFEESAIRITYKRISGSGGIIPN